MKTDQTARRTVSRGKEQSLQRAGGAAPLQGGLIAARFLGDGPGPNNPPIGNSVTALLTNKPGVTLVLKRLRENQVLPLSPPSNNELKRPDNNPQDPPTPICPSPTTKLYNHFFDDSPPLKKLIKNPQRWPLKGHSAS